MTKQKIHSNAEAPEHTFKAQLTGKKSRMLAALPTRPSTGRTPFDVNAFLSSLLSSFRVPREFHGTSLGIVCDAPWETTLDAIARLLLTVWGVPGMSSHPIITSQESLGCLCVVEASRFVRSSPLAYQKHSFG